MISLPGWASNLLSCLCSPQPFSRGKAWQKPSDEGWLRLGTHTIPLCLSRADICNHLPSCLLSPDGWFSPSQMAATTIGSQITLPLEDPEEPQELISKAEPELVVTGSCFVGWTADGNIHTGLGLCWQWQLWLGVRHLPRLR